MSHYNQKTKSTISKKLANEPQTFKENELTEHSILTKHTKEGKGKSVSSTKSATT
jgi:hypothetical protein